MEKIVNEKLGARPTDPVMTVFEQKLEESRTKMKTTCTLGAVPQHGRCGQDLNQTTTDISPALLPRCFIQFPLQAIINTPRGRGCTVNLWRISKLGLLRMKPLKVSLTTGNHVVCYLSYELSDSWCVTCIEKPLINVDSQIRRWTEQKEKEKQSFWPQVLGAHPQSLLWYQPADAGTRSEICSTAQRPCQNTDDARCSGSWTCP